MKTRVKLEGEELERYLEAEKEKEKSRQTTEATERRYLQFMVLFFMGYFSSSGWVILVKYDMRFFHLLKEATGVDKVLLKN